MPRVPNQKRNYTDLNKRLDKYCVAVRKLYADTNKRAADIAFSTGYTKESGVPFSFSHFAESTSKIDKLMSKYATDLQVLMLSGIKKEWNRSNKVQDNLANECLKYYYKDVNGVKQRQYYKPNTGSLQAFVKRKDNGISLSDRIWNLSKDYKKGIENTISIALERGTNAKTLAKQLTKYLRCSGDVNREYKKMYGIKGSASNIDYRAMRLARSEMNMAYRVAEQERWRQFDFVVGYEVRTNEGGHRSDICDDLAGVYPKDFDFWGWHPCCRCYVVPILKTLKGFKTGAEESVKELPSNFDLWVTDNIIFINSNMTYDNASSWVYANKDYVYDARNISGKVLYTEERVNLSPSKIKDLSLVNSFFKDFSKENLDLFPKGFNKFIPISSSNRGYMGSLLNGTYYINFAYNNMGYNAGEELIRAIDKIKKGIGLSKYEEYSIENVWHELMHDLSANTTILPDINSPLGFPRAVVETVNQLLARLSYGYFLERLGSKSEHFNWVLNYGFAYNHTVANLRKLIQYTGIEKEKFLKEADKLLMQDYTDFDNKISSLLKKMYKGKGDIENVFQFIEHKDFSELLKVLNKGL